MGKTRTLSSPCIDDGINKKRKLSTLILDLKLLFKFPVLIANALPVFVGFWLALHSSHVSFIDYWGIFLLTIFGSSFVMAGALVINNWYDVDIDEIMERTKHRPTVTGNFSLSMVFLIGITCTIIGFILLLFTTMEATFYAFIGWF